MQLIIQVSGGFPINEPLVRAHLGRYPRARMRNASVWVDALTEKVREGGRIVNVALSPRPA